MISDIVVLNAIYIQCTLRNESPGYEIPPSLNMLWPF